jgi:hypothetical protein
VKDSLALGVVHDGVICGSLVFVGLSGFIEGTELVVPIGLKRVGNESIGWINLHVPQSGLLSFVLHALDLLPPNAIGLFGARLHFALNRQCDPKGHRRELGKNEIADGVIEFRARD